MKYSKLLLSVLAVSMVTVASANKQPTAATDPTTDTSAVVCNLGQEICDFPGEGAIVYFDNLTAGQYVCALSVNSRDTKFKNVVVKINDGGTSTFAPQALHVGSPILINLNSTDNGGQIKGHLIGSNLKDKQAAIGLQCSEIVAQS